MHEVLTEVRPVDLVRLLTWFFSTTDSPGAAPGCSMGEVLATAMQLRAEAFVDNTTLGLESSHAPVCGFSCVNKQPSTLGSHSSSIHVQH